LENQLPTDEMKIFLALADITAFRFLRMHADVTGAFRFMAEEIHFLAMSVVFGSNMSESSWERFRRAIQSLIPYFSIRTNLVENLKAYLICLFGEMRITQFASLSKLLSALWIWVHWTCTDLLRHIYVDDILASGVGKQDILRLLAAIIEAVFIVCGCSIIEVRQCPLFF